MKGHDVYHLAVGYICAGAGGVGLSGALFAQPLHNILTRIIDDPISEAWVRYMKFAVWWWACRPACASASWKNHHAVALG